VGEAGVLCVGKVGVVVEGEAQGGEGDAPVKTSHTPTRPPPTVASRVPSGLHAQDVTGPGRVSCRSSAQASLVAILGCPVFRSVLR